MDRHTAKENTDTGKKELTMQSTVGELYGTPIGHDLLSRILLQAGIPGTVLKNPAISRLRLSSARKLAKEKIDDEFFEILLRLVNREQAVSGNGKGPVHAAWWKEAVFYQIYPRSFYDADGDGVGDLKGILEKLDDLKDLGVDALWLSPVYDSPNDDNGYDIRDYRKIMTEFGTMEDFDRLLAEVHRRGMRLIMDLVVNHTSDEHEWFQEALKDPASPKRKYYFMVDDPEGKTPPTNWVSFFGGSAWKYFPEQKVWALHLFSEKQMDLNWDHPEVRADVADLVNFWLDKGVDGFRMDVINYISKERCADGTLPQGNEAIGKLMMFYGVEHYFYGPHLHEYLQELTERSFAPHGAFSVGETPGPGMEMSKLLTGEERGELNMIFSFDHLDMPGKVRFDDYRYDLNYYRDYITDWMEHYGNNCWMSLFYNNHDNPRMASKVAEDPSVREAVQTLLAVMQFTLKGTPFIFQGDELGLVNYQFTSIEQLTDVEARNRYAELCQAGMPAEEAFRVICAGTREHARVLMPWNRPAAEENKAVGDKVPTYIPQEMHPEIRELYRFLIAYRKEHQALVYGRFELINEKNDRFIYRRTDGVERFVIEANLGEKQLKPVYVPRFSELVLRTKVYEDRPMGILSPYEVRLWKE